GSSASPVLVSFAAEPPAPVLGRVSFPTSGAAAAQPAFVRGVLYLHSFEYDDAIASFREAQTIDPGFAMAYWGEALAYNQPLWQNENVPKARAALAALKQRGQTRSPGLTPARTAGLTPAVAT